MNEFLGRLVNGFTLDGLVNSGDVATTSRTEKGTLFGRVQSVYAGAMGWSVLGLLAVVAIGGTTDWFRGGYVEAPRAGEVLNLTGVPGDEINLKLPVPKDAELEKRELFVRLQDGESDFEAVLPLDVRVDEDEDRKPLAFYGRFAVPEVPGQPRSSLTGALIGSYQLHGGEREAFRVPLTLQTVRRGEAATSGFKDMGWRYAVLWALVGFFVAVWAPPVVLQIALGIRARAASGRGSG